MNRTIQFNAWDIDDKSMFYNVLVANSGNYICLQYNVDETDLDMSYTRFDNSEGRTILLQYIGLSDKKGEEIYEGDVLRAADNSGDVVIEFRGGQFVGVNTNNSHPIQETQNRNWLQWEVIGNRFQNPELLKQN